MWKQQQWNHRCRGKTVAGFNEGFWTDAEDFRFITAEFEEISSNEGVAVVMDLVAM